MEYPRISAVVPNFDGRDLLERYLPSVIREVGEYPGPAEILVVDDGSRDGSPRYVRESFPNVRVIDLGRNRGALDAKNAGFEASDGDLILCLNNDVELTPGFLPPMVPLFEDPELFGVGPRMLLMSKGLRDESLTAGELRRGRFGVLQPGLMDSPVQCNEVSPVLYPHGGACLYDRAKLLALGGYDRIYHPIYWDDLDVGYAAWKRGWKCLYQPASTALHQHMATTLRTGGLEKVHRLLERNMLLFTWKNVTDAGFTRSHVAWLGLRLAASIARGRLDFPRALRSALSRLPAAVSARRRELACQKRSDAEVLAASRGKL